LERIEEAKQRAAAKQAEALQDAARAAAAVASSPETEGGTGSKRKRIAIPRTDGMVRGAWNWLMGKGKRDAAAEGGGSALAPTQLQAAAARTVEGSSSSRPATELGPAGCDLTAGSSGGMFTALLPRSVTSSPVKKKGRFIEPGRPKQQQQQQQEQQQQQQQQQEKGRGRGRPRVELGADLTGRTNVRHLTEEQKDEKIQHFSRWRRLFGNRNRSTEARVERLQAKIEQLTGLLDAVSEDRQLLEGVLEAHRRCLAANADDRFRAKGKTLTACFLLDLA
jgi:hypothetical protein